MLTDKLIDLLMLSEKTRSEVERQKLIYGNAFFEVIRSEKNHVLSIRLLSDEEISKDGLMNKMIIKE